MQGSSNGQDSLKNLKDRLAASPRHWFPVVRGPVKRRSLRHMRERERAPRGLRWNRQTSIGMFSQVTSQRACFEWSEARKPSRLAARRYQSFARRDGDIFPNIFSELETAEKDHRPLLVLTVYTICSTPIGSVGSSIFCSRRFPKLRTCFFCAGVNRRTRYGVCVRNSSLTLSTRKRSPLTGMRRYCSSSRSGVRKPKPRAFTRKRSGEFRNSFRSSAAETV